MKNGAVADPQLILDHRKLYRLPWTTPDNAQAWLDVTRKCNLACHGCFLENKPEGHKTLKEVSSDLEVFRSFRTVDSMLIAGGEPLLHPEIVEIVAMVARKGLKPIILTNGLALTQELLLELKRAGAVGFVFHVDSTQGRPGWKDKNEIELNELRLHFAEMVAEVGLSCAYNVTVLNDNLGYVGEIVEWAQQHIDIIQGVGLCAFRSAVVDGAFDYCVNGEKVDYSILPSSTTDQTPHDIQSMDIVAEIRKRIPDFAPAAYLNGTESPSSLKWLLSTYIGTRERTYGYVGPRTAEFTQIGHHLMTGRYLAYSKPEMSRHGRAHLALAPFDSRIREIGRRYLGAIIRRPSRLLRPLYIQSVIIVQPTEILIDGRFNMCDGCPDITTWDGQLVWSCRIEEREHFSNVVQAVPQEERVTV